MNKIEQYNTIMKQYHNGEFGTKHLSLYKILEKAGFPNLLQEMSFDELQELYDKASGGYKNMFKLLLDKKGERV